MGSTGTNSFTDYPSRDSSSDSEVGGGDENTSQCSKAIGDVLLEDVANCNFYKSYKKLPEEDSIVYLRNTLVGGRLVIQNTDYKIIGLLPTQLNYLRHCIEQGYSYFGVITSTRNKPLPTVIIDLAPYES